MTRNVASGAPPDGDVRSAFWFPSRCPAFYGRRGAGRYIGEA